LTAARGAAYCSVKVQAGPHWPSASLSVRPLHDIGEGKGWSAARIAGVMLWLAGTPPLVAQQFPPPLRNSTSAFRWSSYVQFRYTNIENAEDLYALRRLKLMMGGNLTPRIQWYAQGLFKDGNQSPTDGRVYFQEAWRRFEITKRASLVIGQFKPPFGRERFTPDFLIPTIDRSLVTDALPPDGPYVDSFYRDRGIQLDGEARPGLRYALAAFDGRGANHQFHGVGPLLAGQLTHDALHAQAFAGHPLNVRAGASASFRWGRDLPFRPCCAGDLAAAVQHFRGTDRRWNTELSIDWAGALVRAEYMRATLCFDSPGARNLTAAGWYLLGAKHISSRWQLVAKYERFDPDRFVVSSSDARQTTLGLNYYFRENRCKLMAGYVIRQELVRPTSNDLFQLQLQYFLH